MGSVVSFRVKVDHQLSEIFKRLKAANPEANTIPLVLNEVPILMKAVTCCTPEEFKPHVNSIDVKPQVERDVGVQQFAQVPRRKRYGDMILEVPHRVQPPRIGIAEADHSPTQGAAWRDSVV